MRAVRTGALKPEPCSDLIDINKPACAAAIVANGDLSMIDSIAECPSPAGAVCYVVNLHETTELTIKAQVPADALAPDAVTSIAIEQYLIIT